MSEPPLWIEEADIDDEQGTLTIHWSDGHESVYPLEYVRSECPCASCRAEREESRANPFHVLKAAPNPRMAEIADVEPVGRYGMRLTWGDGHATGIYTFEHLREICPCETCKAARKPHDTPYVHGIYIPQ